VIVPFHFKDHFKMCDVFDIGLGTHLFVKVPRPGDSEVTFSVFESRQAGKL